MCCIFGCVFMIPALFALAGSGAAIARGGFKEGDGRETGLPFGVIESASLDRIVGQIKDIDRRYGQALIQASLSSRPGGNLLEPYSGSSRSGGSGMDIRRLEGYLKAEDRRLTTLTDGLLRYEVPLLSSGLLSMGLEPSQLVTQSTSGGLLSLPSWITSASMGGVDGAVHIMRSDAAEDHIRRNAQDWDKLQTLRGGVVLSNNIIAVTHQGSGVVDFPVVTTYGMARSTDFVAGSQAATKTKLVAERVVVSGNKAGVVTGGVVQPGEPMRPTIRLTQSSGVFSVRPIRMLHDGVSPAVAAATEKLARAAAGLPTSPVRLLIPESFFGTPHVHRNDDRVHESALYLPNARYIDGDNLEMQGVSHADLPRLALPVAQQSGEESSPSGAIVRPKNIAKTREDLVPVPVLVKRLASGNQALNKQSI